MDIHPNDLTISSALRMLHAREISAVALTQACLERIERLNPELNAFITVTTEAALSQAKQVDDLLKKRAANLTELTLFGMPLAVKDLFETAEVLTTGGTRFFQEYIPGEDARSVLKLKLAGAVILGKTNTHEIALGLTGINPHFGTVHNPWNFEHIAGGSSSGSAAAVAAGLCLGALGTDTGGSVRVPAAFCGVVGLKPTYGRVSLRGVMPLSWNLDHVGTLTNSVRDAALLLSVISGYDPHDPASVHIEPEDFVLHTEGGVKGLSIALAAGDYVEASDPQVVTSLEEAARCWRSAGARVEKVDVSWLGDLAQANSRIIQADAATIHRERLVSHPDWFGEDVRQRLETGSSLTAGEYILARRTQAEGRRRFETFFTKYDLIALPTVPVPAPSIEGVQAVEAARQLTRFTSPFNLAGLPALSLPCGLTKTGLPMGLQIAAKHWAEGNVLRAGRVFEQAVGGFPKPAIP